ncbi:MAG: nitroreductase family deazaflavin-dependent oxidoreductase [Actinobacteria bacterium]|nr:nitroreductase family deazaflavin-dependent oxidoreductase [Actinomycetota bacterium]
MGRPFKAVILLAAIALAAVGTIAVAIRWQITPVLTAVRKFNRGFTNPRALRVAGSESSSTGIIHHVGRRSGRSYRTPITALRVGDGFVIALPYGTNADWVRNVLASGGALIETAGQQSMTRNPVIVPTADVSAALPYGQRQTLRMFGVTQCLRLEIVAS